MKIDKKLGAAAVLAALAIAALAGWWFLRKDQDPRQLELHGNVDIRQVSLAFEGNGRVLEMNAQEGDPVSAGRVLGRLDTATLALQAQQVEARMEAQRQATLRLRNGARPEELAQARARLTAAE